MPAYGSPNISSPSGCAEGVLVARSKQLEKALGKSSGSAPQPIMCTFEYLLKK